MPGRSSSLTTGILTRVHPVACSDKKEQLTDGGRCASHTNDIAHHLADVLLGAPVTTKSYASLRLRQVVTTSQTMTIPFAPTTRRLAQASLSGPPSRESSFARPNKLALNDGHPTRVPTSEANTKPQRS